MIYELRTYTLKPGTVPEFLEVFDKEMKSIVTKYMNLAGFWYTEFGELNQVVHLWAFEDLNQRAEQRARFSKDPDLAGILPRLRSLELHQENKILMPAQFSPLK